MSADKYLSIFSRQMATTVYIGPSAENTRMDSACPRKMPGWIVPVRENFSVNRRVCRKQTIEFVLRGFRLCSFSNFTFGFHS